MQSTDRLLDVPPFPCSCPCSTMVKSAIIYEQQGDDELQLVGGYVKTGQSGLTCQRIELNVSSCNNQSIPKITITFPSSSDDCLKANFWLYRDDGGQEVTYLSNFNPLTSSGELTINPSIAPCSSRTVIFYICSNNMSYCEHDDYTMNVSVGGQNPACDKSMTWHFDFLTQRKQNLINLLINDRSQSSPGKYKIKILNIFNLEVFNYSIDDLNDIRDLTNQFNFVNGFYIVNIYKENILVYQEKLLIQK